MRSVFYVMYQLFYTVRGSEKVDTN